MYGDNSKQERMRYDGPATFPNGCNYLNAAKCDGNGNDHPIMMGRIKSIKFIGGNIKILSDNERMCCPLGDQQVDGHSWGFARYQCQCNQNPIKCKPSESLEQIERCDNSQHDTATKCIYKMVFS